VEWSEAVQAKAYIAAITTHYLSAMLVYVLSPDAQ